MAWRLIAEVQGSAREPYRVALQDAGVLYGQLGCTCPAYRFTKGKAARSCKHTARVLAVVTQVRGSLDGVHFAQGLNLTTALLREFGRIARAPGATPDLDLYDAPHNAPRAGVQDAERVPSALLARFKALDLDL